MIIIPARHLLFINAGLFQLNWFACIMIGGLFSVVSTSLLLLVHFLIMGRALQEWVVMIGFASTGFFLDTAIMQSGYVKYASPLNISLGDTSIVLAPVWLLMLWLSFSTCLCHSLGFFHARKWLTVSLVLACIPINYFLGAKLTGTQWTSPAIIPIIMTTLYWVILLPLTFALISSWVRGK